MLINTRQQIFSRVDFIRLDAAAEAVARGPVATKKSRVPERDAALALHTPTRDLARSECIYLHSNEPNVTQFAAPTRNRSLNNAAGAPIKHDLDGPHFVGMRGTRPLFPDQFILGVGQITNQMKISDRNPSSVAHDGALGISAVEELASVVGFLE
jgi:hypothetical protein